MKKLIVMILVLLCLCALVSCGGEISQTTRPKHYHSISEEWVIGKEPLCGSPGYNQRLCETCGEPIEYQEVAATGFHVYTDWIEVQSGGCSAVSYRVQICEQCGHTVVDAPEGVDVVHPHEFELIMEEATCTLPGIEYRFECKNCHFVAAEKYSLPLGHSTRGQKYSQHNEIFHSQVCTRCGEDVMEAHSLGSPNSIDAPSCVTSGSANGTCDKCGASGDFTIPALGHLYIGGECEYVDEEHHSRACVRCEESILEDHTVLLWKTVEKATCYENGLAEGECISCGGHVERVTDDYHDYEIVSYDSGSCTEGGSATYKCSMCGKTITVDGLAPGHIYYRVRTVTEPTCSQSGVGIKKCASCGEEKEYTIYSLGHKYSSGVTVRAASCHREGLVKYTCQREGCSHVSEVTTSRYHNFNSGIVTLEPTCERDGEIVYTCKSCGVEVEYSIPACHNLTSYKYIAPACENEGQAKYYTCNDCGRYFSKHYSYRVYLEHQGRVYYTKSHTTTRYIETTYEKTILAPLGHSYTSYFNSFDGDNHHRKCENGCGNIIETQPHELINCFEIYTVRDSSGYIYYIYSRVDCTVCGYYAYGKLDVDYEGIGGGYILPCDPVEVLHEHATYEVVPMKFPTCTEEGLTPGLLCGECGKVLYEQEPIPAFGHDFVDDVCKRCGAENASQGLEYTLNDDGESYSVTGIGTCTDTDIIIPKAYQGLPVTGIGDSAFYRCESIVSVEMPNSVATIGDSAFSNCINLIDVTLSDTITIIPFGTFGGCYKLSNINIPNSTITIGSHAFSSCKSLINISIPASVEDIAHQAFSQCDSLINFDVDENNAHYKSIDGNLYSKDGKILIQYAIGKNDKSFIVPDCVDIIGSVSFMCCTSLEQVIIGDNVSVIQGHAFWYCTSITNIEISNSVLSIEYSAFENCTSLVYIVIPYSVTSIAGDSFSGCISLTSIEVDEDNDYYCSVDGNLYNEDVTTLIQYAIGKTDTSFTIPDSVTSVAGKAFSSCYSLTSVVIGNSVTSIGNYAFRSCASLTSIVIPDSVTSIGYETFSGCTSLTSVEIPDYVTSIGWYAFKDCTSLTSVEIPYSVTSIGDDAFQFCYSLTIYCEAESQPTGWDSSWNSSNRPVVWGYKGE